MFSTPLCQFFLSMPFLVPTNLTDTVNSVIEEKIDRELNGVTDGVGNMVTDGQTLVGTSTATSSRGFDTTRQSESLTATKWSSLQGRSSTKGDAVLTEQERVPSRKRWTQSFQRNQRLQNQRESDC